MGIFSAVVVGVVGGAVVMTGGVGLGIVAPLLGFSSTGIVAGSTAAAAQAFVGNVAAGSVVAKMTSLAMLAPTP